MVSSIFYVRPYLGKWSNLTNIFQMGWFNHQLDSLDNNDPLRWSLVGQVLERQLAFDANTADRMIVSRCHTPSMKDDV